MFWISFCSVVLPRADLRLDWSADSVGSSQERLLSLIAGHLLDVNSHEGFSEAQQANMTRNIADAVELLPKLTTGIDVDIMFDDINGFKVISNMQRCVASITCQKCLGRLPAP